MNKKGLSSVIFTNTKTNSVHHSQRRKYTGPSESSEQMPSMQKGTNSWNKACLWLMFCFIKLIVATFLFAKGWKMRKENKKFLQNVGNSSGGEILIFLNKHFTIIQLYCKQGRAVGSTPRHTPLSYLPAQGREESQIRQQLKA